MVAALEDLQKICLKSLALVDIKKYSLKIHDCHSLGPLKSLKENTISPKKIILKNVEILVCWYVRKKIHSTIGSWKIIPFFYFIESIGPWNPLDNLQLLKRYSRKIGVLGKSLKKCTGFTSSAPWKNMRQKYSSSILL